MVFVLRWYRLASASLSIWQHVAIDLMSLNAMTYLKLVYLSIASSNYLMWMVIIWLSWNFTSSVEQSWILWNSLGRPFDSARFNYVVIDYNIELVQMIIALERTILNIWNYLLAFDDSYNLLKTYVTNQFTCHLFKFGSLQRAFTNWSHVGLSSQRNVSLS